jgi:hypothetical protein
MPKKPAAKLSAKEREKWFITLFVNAGATEQAIAKCEKRAKLSPGEGKQILRKKVVKVEIERRMQPIRDEQKRQQMITDAAAIAKQSLQDDLSSKVTAIQRMTIQPEVLEHELMMMVVGLNMHMWPKEKLDAIKAAYIVKGTIEANNSRRITPPENQQPESSPGLYTSLFNRLALGPPKAESAPVAAEEGVYDLVPEPSKTPAPAAPRPPAEESTASTKPPSRVITVEVG